MERVLVHQAIHSAFVTIAGVEFAVLVKYYDYFTTILTLDYIISKLFQHHVLLTVVYMEVTVLLKTNANVPMVTTDTDVNSTMAVSMAAIVQDHLLADACMFKPSKLMC